MSEFLRVLDRKDLPEGKGVRVDVKGRAVALFNVGGKFYAIDNICLHQGGPLAEGEMEGKIVICPWHRWRFNVTTGENDFEPNIKVPTFPVKVDGDDVLVGV